MLKQLPHTLLMHTNNLFYVVNQFDRIVGEGFNSAAAATEWANDNGVLSFEVRPQTDPRAFLRHMALASLWCQYNGQKGTEKQTLRVMRQLTADDLVRMLTERGVAVKESLSAHGVAVSGE